MTDIQQQLTHAGMILAQSLFDAGRTGDAATVRSLIDEMNRLAKFAYPPTSYIPKRGE